MILQEFLLTILQGIIVIVTPLLTCFAVRLLKAKTEEAKSTIQNDLARRALAELNDVVPKAVLCIAQTYVDSLKKSGQFSADNQREALGRARNQAQSMLTTGAANYLRRAHGGLSAHLETQVEAAVRRLK